MSQLDELPRNTDDLKAIIEMRKIYKNGHFRICYEAKEYRAVRNCMFSFSEITRVWLWKTFPNEKWSEPK